MYGSMFGVTIFAPVETSVVKTFESDIDVGSLAASVPKGGKLKDTIAETITYNMEIRELSTTRMFGGILSGPSEKINITALHKDAVILEALENGTAVVENLGGNKVLTTVKDVNKAPILSMEGDFLTILLGLAIGVGFLQIVFGLGVKGYMSLRDGSVTGAIFDSLFWITTLLGIAGWMLSLIGIIPGSLNGPSGILFIVSAVGLAATQGRDSPSIGGKIGNGLYAVYGLTSYVGDFVSYTRIIALALSGAYIAFSFNLMAGLLPAGPARWIGGGIIIVVGQTMDLGLAVLGAYVHTCRLQYVEYFGKFYEGGGVPFKPFNMQIESVTIKK
jgi:vacuolar-type H+-ATPase subunit I/STV1